MGRLAFVPTMGNLHEGHLSLVQAGFQHGDTVAASIFVNRLQFGVGEDFDSYPRTFEADCAKLEAAGVQHVFAPDERAMYPVPQTYQVIPNPLLSGTLDGVSRPGHFQGVCTVVTKLLNIVQPNVMLLGKKDYQQVMILEGMVKDFALPVKIVPVPICRAEDGLALSSRNGYLSKSAREKAPLLHKVLQGIQKAIEEGAQDFVALEKQGMETLLQAGWVPDYIAIRRQRDLQSATVGEPLVILGAAKLEGTRLIDNVEPAFK